LADKYELVLPTNLFDPDDFDEDYFLIQRQKYKYELKAKKD